MAALGLGPFLGQSFHGMTAVVKAGQDIGKRGFLGMLVGDRELEQAPPQFFLLLPQQLLLAYDARTGFQSCLERFRIHRLDEMIVSAGIEGFGNPLVIIDTGDHDDVNGAPQFCLTQPLDELKAIVVWHQQIGDEQLRLMMQCLCQPVAAIVGHVHRMPGGGEELLQQ